jgi:NTF2 fold immunity protein
MRRLLVMGLLAGLLGCNMADTWGSMTSTKCTVMRVAERHIALHYPEFDSIESPPILEDNGDTWLVYYKLPKDTLGGTPEVIVDKRTLKVLRAYHTQ